MNKNVLNAEANYLNHTNLSAKHAKLMKNKFNQVNWLIQSHLMMIKLTKMREPIDFLRIDLLPLMVDLVLLNLKMLVLRV